MNNYYEIRMKGPAFQLQFFYDSRILGFYNGDYERSSVVQFKVSM
jgi:hypothetical protein